MTFTETQKFSPAIFWFVGLLPLGILVITLLLTRAPSEAFLTGSLLILALILPLMLFFKFLRLKTDIDRNGISIDYKFLTKKYFSWSDIESAEIIDYGFVGYGIRLSMKHGTIYNTAGSEGLWLKFKNGKKVIIGTQRKTELKRFLDKHLPKVLNS